MPIWTTARGHILWLGGAADTYVEIDPGTMSVRAIHAPGSYSYEDELYEWTVFVDGGDLRKRTNVTKYGDAPTTSVATAVEGIAPMSGPNAQAAESGARTAFGAYQTQRRTERNALQVAHDERMMGFLNSLPDPCSHLVFRRLGRGWSVSLRDAMTPFWTDDTYPWRGTDLHSQLRKSLVSAGKEVASFDHELLSLSDELCYHGE